MVNELVACFGWMTSIFLVDNLYIFNQWLVFFCRLLAFFNPWHPYFGWMTCIFGSMTSIFLHDDFHFSADDYYYFVNDLRILFGWFAFFNWWLVLLLNNELHFSDMHFLVDFFGWILDNDMHFLFNNFQFSFFDLLFLVNDLQLIGRLLAISDR